VVFFGGLNPACRGINNHKIILMTNCYRTDTQILSGNSHVEAMAGGCAIMENYTATQAYSGKSFNFYDTTTGKWERDRIGSGGPGDRQHYYNGEYKNCPCISLMKPRMPTVIKQRALLFSIISAEILFGSIRT
jgi:hypothetical protein